MENNEKIKENKEIAKEVALEEVISKAIQIPGVKVSRYELLKEVFADKQELLADIIKNGPVEAGVSREEINNIVNKLIMKRTSQSSIASFIAGIPGGFALAATIPADMLQFFGMSLRLAQEISYIYGAEDLWENNQVDDEKVKNQLILYCGVMLGVSGAISGVRILSTQIAKTALRKIPQKALTKTFWYPIIKKICSYVGYTLTKKTLASGVSKVIPIVGGVISGSINFASMIPMAKRLNNALDESVFNYSDAEFEEDIKVLENETGEVSEEEKNKFTARLSEEFDNAKEGITNFITNIGNKLGKKDNFHQEDKYEELKKLKELLDMQIITQEEFEKKKKEILGL